MSETYTIHVRDEVFHLTKDQVEFNSPNYFTSCFFGDSVESQTRTLRLFRDPDLFKIVIDYLSGYQVLPLHGSVIPKRMSLELAVRNLRVDADYYLLDGLVDQIVEYQENDPPATSNAPEKIAHVLVIYQGGKWGAPAYILPDLATELRRKHGLSGGLHTRWGGHAGEIKEILQRAGITKTFLIEASWQEVDFNAYGGEIKTDYLVLNIV